MTDIILFNYAEFVANPQFAAFANPSVYPEVTIQAYWNSAINYISNVRYCGNIQDEQRRYAIDLMTAHLMYLSTVIAAGQVPGIMQNAQVDKVSVGLTPPPLKNDFDWWLMTSPYGQMLLALLNANTVGGEYYGGSAPRLGFNQAGTFSWWR